MGKGTGSGTGGGTGGGKGKGGDCCCVLAVLCLGVVGLAAAGSKSQQGSAQVAQEPEPSRQPSSVAVATEVRRPVKVKTKKVKKQVKTVTEYYDDY